VTDRPGAPGSNFKKPKEKKQMQIYAITLEATAQRTITLAAGSLAEAEARAKDFFDFNDCMTDLSIVEAAAIEEASK
jgi:hypothetical protein